MSTKRMSAATSRRNSSSNSGALTAGGDTYELTEYAREGYALSQVHTQRPLSIFSQSPSPGGILVQVSLFDIAAG